jgi:hypothetical protein
MLLQVSHQSPRQAGDCRPLSTKVADIVDSALSCTEEDWRLREAVAESIDAAEPIFSTVVNLAGEDVLG